MSVATRNKIFLKGDIDARYDEGVAASAFYPGYLIEQLSTGKFQAHSQSGGRYDRIVAIEDSLQGNTVETVYAADEVFRYRHVKPGDWFQLVVKGATAALSVGDTVISNGDGTIRKAVGVVLVNNVANSTTITNTTAETTFSNGTVTIPANTLKVSDVLRFRGRGYAPSTNSTDTLTVKLKIGSTVAVTTGAVDVADNDVFTFDFTIIVRTIGASGTLEGWGTVAIGAAGTATTKAVALASTTVDTTAAVVITVTATWSVASASNQAVLQDFYGEETQSQGGEALIGRVQEAKDVSGGATNGFVPVLMF